MVAIFGQTTRLLGFLPHRLELQRPVEVVAGDGGRSQSWITVMEIWGSVVPLRGREFWWAQQVNSQVTHKITMRWNTTVQQGYRFKFGGRVMNIASFINVEEGSQEMEILCIEEVS